jgi:signal transduction histidine kinase
VRRTGWVAAGYGVTAGAWIVLSSGLDAGSAVSVRELERFEAAKGLGFMLVTAVVLFLANYLAPRRSEASHHEVVLRERALLAGERRVFDGLIASSIAHDSNNMIAAVTAELEVVKAQRGPEAHARILESLDQSARLVEAGRQARGNSLRPLEPSAAVRDAVDLVRPHPALRDARVTFTRASMLVSQSVATLVVNAGEAMGGVGAVTVRVVAAGGQARLELEDEGPGILRERREGLFDALVTRKPDGDGVGLFSVKAAAQVLGGRVSVGEAPCGGALSRVSSPLRASKGLEEVHVHGR